MKGMFAPLLAMASFPLLAADTPTVEGKRPEMLVGMEVAVAADGAVTGVTPDAKLPEALRQMLIKRVSQWRYKPAVWQGRPVSTTAYLILRLQPVPTTQGGFALRVLGEGNALLPDTGYRLNPPSYPQGAARQGIGGEFIYAVTKTVDGSLTDIRLLEPAQPGKDRHTRDLDEASRQAILSSRLWPSIVDGTPVACETLIPMKFSVVKGRMPEDSEPDKAWQQHMDELRSRTADLCPATVLDSAIDDSLL